MSPFGDLRLLDNAGGALERMGQPEQPLGQGWATAALFEIESACRKLIEQIARLEPEIFVRVLRHPSTRHLRPDQPQKILRQRCQLGRCLKRLAGTRLGFLRRLGDVRDRDLHLLHGGRLLLGR